ncbi:hypothetical protein QL285_036347 [Trifolium repens]|nr:hypothetical protein QL285_036347 [Trifolium repens]
MKHFNHLKSTTNNHLNPPHTIPHYHPNPERNNKTEVKQRRNISHRKHHCLTHHNQKKQRQQLNTLHTDLSKLQPTKASSSVETAGSFWYKQKVYICDLIA